MICVISSVIIMCGRILREFAEHVCRRRCITGGITPANSWLRFFAHLIPLDSCSPIVPIWKLRQFCILYRPKGRNTILSYLITSKNRALCTGHGTVNRKHNQIQVNLTR